ncbi:Frigida-like [Parasponia andersonii]|uniref:FRIGIDA-like protein n=1 Tax=Parasponia andersonii TaxID=3476 RepID=A0A2P5B3E5_PARAD|nr:Frigida-like [Parasponia andersonii]
MATTLETISESLQPINTKKEKLKKPSKASKPISLSSPPSPEEPSSVSEPDNQNRVEPVPNGVANLVAPRAELVAFCEKMDGLGLRNYVCKELRERYAIRQAPDPGALVPGGMEGFYNEKGDEDFELRTVRKSCALLLEQLMAVCPDVGVENREKAKNLV